MGSEMCIRDREGLDDDFGLHPGQLLVHDPRHLDLVQRGFGSGQSTGSLMDTAIASLGKRLEANLAVYDGHAIFLKKKKKKIEGQIYFPTFL